MSPGRSPPFDSVASLVALSKLWLRPPWCQGVCRLLVLPWLKGQSFSGLGTCWLPSWPLGAVLLPPGNGLVPRQHGRQWEKHSLLPRRKALSVCPGAFPLCQPSLRQLSLSPAVPGSVFRGAGLRVWLSLAVGISLVQGWLACSGSTWLPSICFKQRFGLGFAFLERGAPCSGSLEGLFLPLGLI